MLQNKTKKTNKFSYSLFCFIYPHYLCVKMISFNTVSFSAETYWNVSPALSGVSLYTTPLNWPVSVPTVGQLRGYYCSRKINKLKE